MENATDTALVEQARKYLANGWSIVPIIPGTKKTYTKWKQLQSRLPSEAEVRDCFTRYPNAEIGMVTGSVSRCHILDADVRNGADPQALLAKYPTGVIAKSARNDGSCHLFYFSDEIICESQIDREALGPGVDPQVEKNIVVLPSPNNGRTWLTFTEPAPFPRELIKKPAPTPKPPDPLRASEASAWLRDHARTLGVTKEEVEPSGRLKAVFPCPWIGDHTAPNADRDAALFVDPAGAVGFNCFHSHCTGRSAADVCATLGLPLPPRAALAATFSVGAPPSRFRRLSSLTAKPDDTLWIWDGFLARGKVTMYAAKMKKGKSSLVFQLMAEAQEGGELLGRAVTPTKFVLISEESEDTLIEKREGYGLTADTVTIMSREDAYPRRQFKETFRAAIVQAEVEGATAIVMDTWAFWANQQKDEEKDAGSAQAIYDILFEAAAKNIGVVVLHHLRKSPGEDATDEVRGSGNITAPADILVTMTNVKGSDTQRTIRVVSRFRNSPPKLIADFVDGRYVLLGTPGELSFKAQVRSLLDVLPLNTPNVPGMTRDEAHEALKGKRISPTRLKELFSHLDTKKLLIKEGRGVKGDPERFWKKEEKPEFINIEEDAA